MPALLSQQLAQLGDRELAGFADCYRAARDRTNCWPLAEAVTVAFGYYGDDAFSDVQNWLICQGEQVYQQILANTDLIVEFVDPWGEAAFAEAEAFGWALSDELGVRPEAAKLVEYQSNRVLPQGVRTDLRDSGAVHLRYPRCAAAREKYLNSQLPSIVLPKTENDRTHPTRKLTLGATWHSRRQ
jgi:hypothetical protein